MSLGLIAKLTLIIFCVGWALVLWSMCAISSKISRYEEQEVKRHERKDTGIFK